MANFEISVKKTLKQEGGFAHVKRTGEVVNFGITHWFLRDIGILPKKKRSEPASAMEVAFVKSLTKERAVELYKIWFWDALGIWQLRDQDLADKVFDLSVNMGPRAIILLQQAVNDLRGRKVVDVDAILGPKTAAAVNTTNPDALLDKLRQVAEIRYKEIAALNTVHKDNLPGWLARLAL